MSRLEELVSSLLYEGYALYPYTPGALKNATPTPFGIVYPPSYAGENGAAFDRIELECLLEAEAPVSAVVRFLQPSGERFEAVERAVELDGPSEQEFDFEGTTGRVSLTIEDTRVRLLVENTTEVPSGLGRADALARSLVSTHPLLRTAGGRFLSPLESGCRSLNTYPVLATPEDDAVIGAAIVLPDHPQLAAESRGSLFDATEIEEALLLHVRTLSDEEREAIAAGDPTVAAMVERAAAATPEDLMALHGVMRPVEEEEPPGERETVVAGRTIHRGAKLVLHPRVGCDAADFMLAGRTATLERIYVDYDDAVHLGVTVDDDPMQQVLRETGRFLFFKTDEVEVTE